MKEIKCTENRIELAFEVASPNRILHLSWHRTGLAYNFSLLSDNQRRG
jgi:hypothetical protein